MPPFTGAVKGMIAEKAMGKAEGAFQAGTGKKFEGCPTCSGTGKCYGCEGTGKHYGKICPLCEGSGRCYQCGGTGKRGGSTSGGGGLASLAKSYASSKGGFIGGAISGGMGGGGVKGALLGGLTEKLSGGGGGGGRGGSSLLNKLPSFDNWGKIIAMFVLIVVATIATNMFLGILVAGIVFVMLFGILVVRGLASKIFESPTALMITGSIAIIAVGLYLVSVGGLQNLQGVGYTSQVAVQGIFDNPVIKQFQAFVQNPFGVQTTGGSYEPSQTTTQNAPNQAYAIDVRSSVDQVQFGQKALTYAITVKNTGTTTIKEIGLTIDSDFPKVGTYGCLRFDIKDLMAAGECTNSGADKNGGGLPPFKCTLREIPPLSEKTIVLTGGSFDGPCVRAGLSQGGASTEILPDVNTRVYVNIKGSTYYPTSSRLAVERIQNDYGALLMQKGIVIQQARGAVYQSGTAVNIDMDMGNQPILSSVHDGALIMKWIEVGSGKIDTAKSPFLFIVTPETEGTCVTSNIDPSTIVLTGEIGCDDSYAICTKTCSDADKSRAINCNTVNSGNSDQLKTCLQGSASLTTTCTTRCETRKAICLTVENSIVNNDGAKQSSCWTQFTEAMYGCSSNNCPTSSTLDTYKLCLKSSSEENFFTCINNEFVAGSPSCGSLNLATCMTKIRSDYDSCMGRQVKSGSSTDTGLLDQVTNKVKSDVTDVVDTTSSVIKTAITTSPMDIIFGTNEGNKAVGKELTGLAFDSRSVTCDSINLASDTNKCYLCDKYLLNSWCNENNPVNKQIATSAPNIKANFDWACSLINSSSNKYHVCATNQLTEELNVFSCRLAIGTPIEPDLNRETKYITAIALYPYEVSAPPQQVNVYCVEGTCP